MTFITGSITNANPGPALYAVIETAALADGWTLDDTVTIGGNTHKVLKSAAAGNTYGLDWFLDINYPTTGTTGGIRFAPFEGYTAASDLGVRGPYSPSTTTTTIDATTYSRFGATGSALETNWANAASFVALSSALTTGAFTYWVSITRNRIIVMLSNNPTRVVFAGFYTPSSEAVSHAGAALFPLIMAVFISTQTHSGGKDANTDAAVTRLPKATTLTQNGWEGCVIVPTIAENLAPVPEGQIGVAASPFTNRITLTPLPVFLSAAGQWGQYLLPSNAAWDHVGQISDVALGFTTSSAVRGDSVTLGSDTWYACTPATTGSATGTAILFRGI